MAATFDGGCAYFVVPFRTRQPNECCDALFFEPEAHDILAGMHLADTGYTYARCVLAPEQLGQLTGAAEPSGSG